MQVAAPTRSALEEYRSFQERVQRVADAHQPALRHAPATSRCTCWPSTTSTDAVTELFRAADICVVTSLHDGMNLVSKEFVAARDDLQGVLVLSRFAGAARELTEALIVNPYHVEETADALHRAATMPAAEQRERMASLRSTVREFNVFRWAGRMLADAGRWRLRARIEARVRRLQAERHEATHDEALVRSTAGQATRWPALMRSRPLLAFDFDGTLAPIVAAPRRRAHPATRVAQRAARGWRVRCRWRSSPGARSPTCAPGSASRRRFVVGNHGAEDETQPLPAAAAGRTRWTPCAPRSRGTRRRWRRRRDGRGQGRCRWPCTTGWRADRDCSRWR